MEEDWINRVRKIVENDLYYYVECPHCQMVFFIEESIDKGYHYGYGNPSFKCKCPHCETSITQVSERRLKLKLERVAEKGEPDPLTKRLSDKLEVEGIDY